MFPSLPSSNFSGQGVFLLDGQYEETSIILYSSLYLDNKFVLFTFHTFHVRYKIARPFVSVSCLDK